MSKRGFQFGLMLMAALVLAPKSVLAGPMGACVVQAQVVATRGAIATNCDADTAISQATTASDNAARDVGKAACGAMTLATRKAVCAARGLAHQTDITDFVTIIPANRGKFAVPANRVGRCVAVTSAPATVTNSASRCIFLFFDVGPQKSATVISQARCGVMCQ
jgi:hypothetical protein